MNLRRAIVVLLASWALLFQGWALASAPVMLLMMTADPVELAAQPGDEDAMAMPCHADKTHPAEPEHSDHSASCCGSNHCDCAVLCGGAAISAEAPAMNLPVHEHFEPAALAPAAPPVYTLQRLRPPISKQT